jgi:hypothetical protein
MWLSFPFKVKTFFSQIKKPTGSSTTICISHAPQHKTPLQTELFRVSLQFYDSPFATLREAVYPRTTLVLPCHFSSLFQFVLQNEKHFDTIDRRSKWKL